MKNKLIKYVGSLILIFTMTVSVSYASTNYRYLTESEIASYTKFEIDEFNINNLKTTPIVDASEKIYDFADLLSSDEENSLYNEVINFISETNLDMYVVTLKDEEAYDYSDIVFADDFYDYNDFGINSTRDGIGILVDIRNDVSGNRYFYITTTGNGMLYFDDTRIDYLVEEFIDKSYNYDGNLNYYDGIKATVIKAKDYALSGIPYDNLDAYIDEYGEYHYEAGYHRKFMSPFEKIKAGFTLSFIIALIATLIFFGINKSKLNTKKIASNANLYLKNDSFKLTRNNDDFVTKHVTSYEISSSSSSGGSSSHHSSSGGSHGGGGGHF